MGVPEQLYQPYAAQHAELNGPGDRRPTASQVLRDLDAEGALRGKVILITGSSGGIGAETARALYETGAQLFLGARDMSKLDRTIDEIIAQAQIKDAPRPQPLELHLDSLQSIRKAVADFTSRSDKLNILITNAGVAFTAYSRTQDGFETQFGTNHLAHFYLFQLLKLLLLQSAAADGTASRVIAISSSAHKSPAIDLDDLFYEKREYNKMKAYCQSKLANVWMSNEVDRRYGEKGLRSVSVHPGVIPTDFGRHLNEAEKTGLGVGSDLYNKLCLSGEQGAATTVWAAVSPYFEDHGGVYLADIGEANVSAEPSAFAAAAPHAYSPEDEARLWKISNRLVGLDEDA